MTTTLDPVDDLVELRSLDRAAVCSRFEVDESDPQTGRSYRSLSGLSLLHRPGRHPARVYLDGDAVVLVYVADPEYLTGVTPAALADQLGDPELFLRSRAGPTSRLAVYPDAGLAASCRRETESVDFLEAFAPTTAADYRREVYDDPGPFLR